MLTIIFSLCVQSGNFHWWHRWPCPSYAQALIVIITPSLLLNTSKIIFTVKLSQWECIRVYLVFTLKPQSLQDRTQNYKHIICSLATSLIRLPWRYWSRSHVHHKLIDNFCGKIVFIALLVLLYSGRASQTTPPPLQKNVFQIWQLYFFFR